MPEKIIIGISVENKIAKADKNAVIVCGNSNYKAVFAFDGEWENYNVKTALFATDKADNDGNGTIAVVFEGNECDIPPLENTTIVGVGVASGDLTQGEAVELATTTPAYIDCLLSIKDLGGVIAPPAPDVYDQIIALLNKYLGQGGGGSGETGGGLTEAEVKEIVQAETQGLQPKVDDGLETESKSVVGAINELNEKKVGFTDYATATKAGVVKNYFNQLASGIEFLSDGSIRVKKADNTDINAKTSETMPIVPKNLDFAVKVGITTNTETWTDEEKAAACDTIGALGKSDIASGKGLGIDANGKLTILQASPDNIFARKGDSLLVPAFLENIMYYGITGYKKVWQNNDWVESRNNQIPLKDEEKASACEWLGAVQRRPNESNGWNRLYGMDSVGNESVYRVANGIQANTIAIRGVNGVVMCGTPSGDNHATNKKYVDTISVQYNHMLTGVLDGETFAGYTYGVSFVAKTAIEFTTVQQIVEYYGAGVDILAEGDLYDGNGVWLFKVERIRTDYTDGVYSLFLVTNNATRFWTVTTISTSAVQLIK